MSNPYGYYVNEATNKWVSCIRNRNKFRYSWSMCHRWLLESTASLHWWGWGVIFQVQDVTCPRIAWSNINILLLQLAGFIGPWLDAGNRNKPFLRSRSSSHRPHLFGSISHGLFAFTNFIPEGEAYHRPLSASNKQALQAQQHSHVVQNWAFSAKWSETSIAFSVLPQVFKISASSSRSYRPTLTNMWSGADWSATSGTGRKPKAWSGLSWKTLKRLITLFTKSWAQLSNMKNIILNLKFIPQSSYNQWCYSALQCYSFLKISRSLKLEETKSLTRSS